MTIKGILFDMDNTLLQSRIDYAAMKRDVYAYLLERKYLPDNWPIERHTTSMLIDEAKRRGMEDGHGREVMELTARHELAGMQGVGLEPGAAELLAALHGSYVLAIVTNNSEPAAIRALEATGILPRFDVVVGRERMEAMKPSPSGYLYAMSRHPDLRPEQWVSLGDSWIDGRGSFDAGVPFVSYRTGLDEMRKRGVQPVARVDSLAQFGEWL